MPKNENQDVNNEDEHEMPEQVREMIEVFESREELQQTARRAQALVEDPNLVNKDSTGFMSSIPDPNQVCVTGTEYKAIVTSLVVLFALLLTVTGASAYFYRRYWNVMTKNYLANRGDIHSTEYLYNTRRSTNSANPRLRSGISNLSLFSSPGLQKPFSPRYNFYKPFLTKMGFHMVCLDYYILPI